MFSFFNFELHVLFCDPSRSLAAYRRSRTLRFLFRRSGLWITQSLITTAPRADIHIHTHQVCNYTRQHTVAGSVAAATASATNAITPNCATAATINTHNNNANDNDNIHNDN